MAQLYGPPSDGSVIPHELEDAIAADLTDATRPIGAALNSAGRSPRVRTLAEAFSPPSPVDYPEVSIYPVATSPLAAAGTLIRETRYTDTEGFASMSKTDPAFRFDGTPELRRVHADQPNYVAPLVLPGGDANVAYYTPAVETVTAPENREVEFRVRAASTAITFRLYVDDHPLTVAARRATGLTAGGGYTIRLVFPTARSRAIKLTFGDASGFGGAYVPAGQVLKRPTAPLGLRVAVIGDSYEGGAGVTPGGGTRLDTGGVLAARILGAGSLWNFGIGGTGYLATEAGFITRIPAVIACSPDFVIVSGTINDGTADTPELRAAVTDVVTQLKAAGLEVYVTGPSRSASYEPNNTAVREAAVAAGAVFIDPLKPSPWLTPAMIGTDGAHPTWEGHQVRAQKIAEGIIPHRAGKIPPTPVLSLTAPPAEPPATVGVTAADTFTREDSSTVGTTETGAFTWVTTAGWSIVGNQLAYSSTTAQGNALVSTGAGAGHLVVRGTFAAAAGVAGALMAHVNADKTAGYALNRGSDNVYKLRRYLGGTSFSDLVTLSGVVAAAGDVGEIEFLANGTIVARVNGVATAAVADGSTRGGSHGFWGYPNHAARFDAFQVEALA